jgi:error-prone DNA polymerase
MFVSLEDETGNVQVIVRRGVKEAQRKELLGSQHLAVNRRVLRQGDACSLVAQRVENATPLLGELETSSSDFR